MEPVAQPAISVKEVGRFSRWREGRRVENMRKRIVLLVTAVVFALTMSLRGVALAKITEKRTNPAGHETQGKGKAITVTNVNPAGKAPPGQN